MRPRRRRDGRRGERLATAGAMPRRSPESGPARSPQRRGARTAHSSACRQPRSTTSLTESRHPGRTTPSTPPPAASRVRSAAGCGSGCRARRRPGPSTRCSSWRQSGVGDSPPALPLAASAGVCRCRNAECGLGLGPHRHRRSAGLDGPDVQPLAHGDWRISDRRDRRRPVPEEPRDRFIVAPLQPARSLEAARLPVPGRRAAFGVPGIRDRLLGPSRLAPVSFVSGKRPVLSCV